ncbi:SecY-interacting protein [Enterobacteriaceae bacterium ESL0689]|nr:SecY-interacting protein [Enterobacteriaceae bacterium ESL0689]
MDRQTTVALQTFTRRYCAAWQQQCASLPRSEALYDIPSPCISTVEDHAVFWQPQSFTLPPNLSGVERALEIVIQPAVHQYYTTQFAGDMAARFADITLTLLQTWSDDDFQRLQANLIGHLVMQKQRKLSPTLFIATLDDDDQAVISVCNLNGEIIKETLGHSHRKVLSPSLANFLDQLVPVL